MPSHRARLVPALRRAGRAASRIAVTFALVSAVLVVLPAGPASAASVTRSASGAAPADIQAAVDQFRTDLGGANNGVGGSFSAGRREIDWDGVPDGFAAPSNLPSNFFNVNSPRGAVFSTAGTGFQVSADSSNPTSTPVEFGNINPDYPNQFRTFSPQRLFTPLDSNVMDVSFFVPGTSTPATVSGFGAVFTDVERTTTSQIQVFFPNGTSSTVSAPIGPTGGLSFLGISFNAGERIAKVRITTGNTALSTSADDSATVDVVALDDFIYGEPLDFVVNSTGDASDTNTADNLCDSDGAIAGQQCTLRAAITQANATANPSPTVPDVIAFNIAGGGPQTISPATNLPVITDPVIIDGYSQPGSSPNTLPNAFDGGLNITIDGSGVPFLDQGRGLRIQGGETTTRGLVVTKFDSAAITFFDVAGNTDNVIQGNLLIENGFDATIGNGVEAFGPGATGNLIGGTSPAARNVIGDNTSAGIEFHFSGDNQVQGNFIGVGDGATIAPNGAGGIVISGGPGTDGSGNLVGGTSTGAGNVISANTGDGIRIGGGSAFGTIIQGNMVGTDATGTMVRGNTDAGISIGNLASTKVGGTAAGAENLISGNGGSGIDIFSNSAPSTGGIIQGNRIGTDVTGTLDFGNTLDGITVAGSAATNNTIGGSVVSARNVISGNDRHGILLSDSSRGTSIQRNFIGLKANGTAPLPNGTGSIGDGILTEAGATGSIGGAATSRNVISGNMGAGVRLTSGTAANHSLVQGNFIGTNAGGNAAIPNGGPGISVEAGARSNVIGGTGAGRGNVISGNARDGVVITGQDTDQNLVLQNKIGLNAAGTGALPNGTNSLHDGVQITGGAQGNIIGGTTATARNVISGNKGNGVLIDGSGIKGTGFNQVQGNFIGTDAAGTAAVPNGDDGGSGSIDLGGVLIQGPASGNFVGQGGGTPGSPPGNLISGNTDFGVKVQGPGEAAGSNQIAGNFIGTNATGTAALPNGSATQFRSGSGVLLSGGAQDTIVGGTGAGARNVISGNLSEGILLEAGFGSTPPTSGNRIQGNFIGTNAAGGVAIPNGGNDEFSGAGIRVSFDVQDTTIGGSTVGARNVISGNAGSGVLFSGGFNTTGTTIQGNFIGTTASGGSALGNTQDGINMGDPGGDIGSDVAGTLIGGPTGTTGAPPGNVISGNGRAGVALAGSGTVLRGNLVGTGAAGTGAVPNRIGVDILSPDLTVGGPTVNSRNVISGNQFEGVRAMSQGAAIQGNFIGTNRSGTGAVPNGVGVRLIAPNGQVGGLAATPGAPPGNVISGNAGSGVLVAGNDLSDTPEQIQGNLIGTDPSGTAALPNGFDGVEIRGAASDALVGGTSATARNVISGNGLNGVRISGDGTSQNLIQGNFIGTDINGTGGLGNGTSGVLVTAAARGNTIGGATAGARNVISGNGASGVRISQDGTSANKVQGNFIGLRETGIGALGNEGNGVSILGGAEANTVGGTTAGAQNVVSASRGSGVLIDGAGTDLNKVLGNLIGTNSSGTGTAFGNEQAGVNVSSGASANRIGGPAAGEGNKIVRSGDDGVLVDGKGVKNAIRGNSIATNDGLGINLEGNGNSNVVTPNDATDADGGPNRLQNFPVIESATFNSGTGNTRVRGTLKTVVNTEFLIDVYRSAAKDPSGFGEGGVFVGSVAVTTGATGEVATVDGTPVADKRWTFTFAGNVTGQFVTATATRKASSGTPTDTSEFALSVQAV